jgi:hypothetical protein
VVKHDHQPPGDTCKSKKRDVFLESHVYLLLRTWEDLEKKGKVLRDARGLVGFSRWARSKSVFGRLGPTAHACRRDPMPAIVSVCQMIRSGRFRPPRMITGPDLHGNTGATAVFIATQLTMDGVSSEAYARMIHPERFNQEKFAG